MQNEMEFEGLAFERCNRNTMWPNLFTFLRRAKEYCIKVDVPNPITYLNLTPIFVWYVLWHGLKKG
jgi:hypothetical protein